MCHVASSCHCGACGRRFGWQRYAELGGLWCRTGFTDGKDCFSSTYGLNLINKFEKKGQDGLFGPLVEKIGLHNNIDIRLYLIPWIVVNFYKVLPLIRIKPRLYLGADLTRDLGSGKPRNGLGRQNLGSNPKLGRFMFKVSQLVVGTSCGGSVDRSPCSPTVRCERGSVAAASWSFVVKEGRDMACAVRRCQRWFARRAAE